MYKIPKLEDWEWEIINLLLDTVENNDRILMKLDPKSSPYRAIYKITREIVKETVKFARLEESNQSFNQTIKKDDINTSNGGTICSFKVKPEEDLIKLEIKIARNLK